MGSGSFEQVTLFHGHSCPGLAIGYRVALVAMDRLRSSRSKDEELVAVVENNSCAVDAIQALAGCTFGKGNLLFKDHGKQVYTFFRRSDGKGLRIVVSFSNRHESDTDREMWRRYLAGDRSAEVTDAVQAQRSAKISAVLSAAEEELFSFGEPAFPLPEPARIYPVLRCDRCGEKVMEPKAIKDNAGVLCIPCVEVERRQT